MPRAMVTTPMINFSCKKVARCLQIVGVKIVEQLLQGCHVPDGLLRFDRIIVVNEALQLCLPMC